MDRGLPSTPEVSSGSRRFVLQGTLGEGSFGAVYVAEMESTGGFKRRVALKLLHPNWDPGSDAGRRLRDEARLLGRLEHRNIVRVDDLLRIDGRWAVLMEYVPGADLEVVIQATISQRGAIPVRASLEIVGAAASALEAAFNARGDDGEPLRVVHRDVKPSNLQLAETGDLKVLDFGVARADFAGREAKTERVRYGSVGYMAPERILGSSETPAGDVYALAVTLYELLTLRTFGRAELRDDKHAEQVGLAMAAVRERLGDQADGIVDLLQRCLQYEPEGRPSAYHVEEAIRALARRFDDDDAATFARDCVAPLVRLRTDESIRGRVLTESQEAREVPARMSGQTIVVPGDSPLDDLRAYADRDAKVGSAAERGENVTFGTPSLDAIERPEPEWSGHLRRFGIPVAILVVIGALFVGAWRPEPAGAPIPVPLAAPTVPLPAPAPAPAEPPAEPAPVVPVAAGAPEVPAVATPPATPRARPPVASPPAPVATAAPETVASPPPETAPGPLLRSVKFTLAGAEGIAVACGAVRGTGAASVLLRNVPAGACLVTAGGATARVEVSEPRGFTCSLAAGALQCR